MGICLKVPALPMPAKKNIASMAARNPGNWPGSVGLRNSAAQPRVTAMPIPETKVQIAPPNRSHSGPQATRTSEPISGPRKAKAAPLGSAAPRPAKGLLAP